MHIGGHLDTALPVYLPSPVNRHHPLNQGRAAWWLTLPGLEGGRQWIDVAGLFSGTLINSFSTNGWRYFYRPGGFGSLLFDGNTSYVDLGNAYKLCTYPFTVSLWVTQYTLASTQIVFWAGLPSASTWNAFYIALDTNGKANAVTAVSNTFTAATGVTTLSGPTRVTAVFASPTSRLIYVNGNLDGSNTTSASPTGFTAAYLGRSGVSSGVSSFNGPVDDVSIWNRALSAAEVKADYDLSRTGYPAVLNRYRPSLETLAPSTSTNVTISPSGISSLEAWGTAALGVATSIAPTGMASAESWGATVLSAAATIAPTGIGSAESWGSTALGASATIAPTGMGSAESWGSTVVSTSSAVIIAPLAIGTAESWGTAALGVSAAIAPVGIATRESWGTSALSASATIAPNAIGTAESWGASVVSTSSAAIIAPLGIPSLESWGSSALGVSTAIAPLGIASRESWGSTVVAGSGGGGGGYYPTRLVATITGLPGSISPAWTTIVGLPGAISPTWTTITNL